ncbi:hypothetical protein [Streptomyces sp. NPDC002855]|uniref:hypothetical protein n=1 Tax=Streptomyces sp. NPDC002855 TaxID=3154437 RepID=UPI00332A2D6E
MDGRRVAPALAAALVMVTGLAGCGHETNRAGEGEASASAAASPRPSPSRTQESPAPEVVAPTGPATAPGRDTVTRPQQVFSGKELEKVLLPDSTFGRRLQRGDEHAMPFESTHEQRRQRWQFCLGGDEDPAWLGPATYRGAEAVAHTLRVIGNEGEAVAVQRLVSLPVASARDHMRVEQDIMRHCPSFSSDMEAGSAQEEYAVEPLEELGDEAYLVIHKIRYEGDVRTEYSAHIRVGGVLASVIGVAGMADREDTVRWAAQLARETGSALYGAGQG